LVELHTRVQAQKIQSTNVVLQKHIPGVPRYTTKVTTLSCVILFHRKQSQNNINSKENASFLSNYDISCNWFCKFEFYS
jgi:hypothetical protein